MLINLRNALMAGKKLPYDNEVEYLESTGTQYIDTGVAPADSSVFTLIAEIPSTSSPNEVLFGSCKANTTSGADTIMLRTYNYPTTYASWLRSGVYGTTVNYPTGIVEFKMDRGNVYFNGSFAYSLQYGTTTSPLSNVCVLSLSSGSWEKLSCKIYGFRHVKSGVLVRDFIPVRKGTVGYLYDRVSGKLFGNAGTGDFVLGPDVVPVEWLQSYATTYIDTGIIPDDTYGMEVTGYTTQTSDSAWIGTRNGTNLRCFMGYSPPLGFYYGWNGRQDIQYTTGVWSTASMNLYNSRKNMMDGTEVGSIAETLGAQNRAIHLFGLTTNGTAGLKLKSALITKGSDDVLKLVSVRVGTDATSWKGAMMDVLTRRIYRNQGTGAFGYGNDLKYPIPAE